MLTSSRSEPVGESSKVFLIYCIEDRHHGVLDNLVFQRRDPQPPLLAVGFRYVDSLGRLGPVRSAVDPAMQIDESLCQPGLALFPRHAVHPGGRFPLQCEVAFPEPFDRHMVEQGGEPLLLVFPRPLAHTLQPLGHPRSTLCWLCVRFHDVLLGHGPSLHCLRVPYFFGSCSAVSSVLRPCSTPRWRSCPDCACRFPDRSLGLVDPWDTGEVSRFSCMQFLGVPLALGLRRARGRLAFASPAMLPSRWRHTVGARLGCFRSSIPRPPMPLSTLHLTSRDVRRKDSRPRWVATPFLWGSFIPCYMPVYPGACAPLRSRLPLREHIDGTAQFFSRSDIRSIPIEP